MRRENAERQTRGALCTHCTLEQSCASVRQALSVATLVRGTEYVTE